VPEPVELPDGSLGRHCLLLFHGFPGKPPLGSLRAQNFARFEGKSLPRITEAVPNRVAEPAVMLRLRLGFEGGDVGREANARRSSSEPRTRPIRSRRRPHNDAPKLTVVILVQSDSWMIRHALRKLREQTIAAEIEVIAVAPAGLDGEWIDEQMQGHWGFTLLRPKRSTIAAGRRKRRPGRVGRLIAFMEDHSYPRRTAWRHIVRAVEEGQLAAAGPVMRNANPDRGASGPVFSPFTGSG